jgi:hypothetical protein
MRRTIAATAATAALTLILAGCAVSGTSSASPSLAAIATSSPAPSATAVPSIAAPATPTPAPTIGGCPSANLAARIVSWEGATGHRIAHVELTNAGSVACLVEAQPKPQLVAGNGSVLLDGTAVAGSPILTVAAGAVVASIVQDDNYCGPDPVAPVTIAFVFSNGRVVATPESPTDTGGVPPCLGPGNPGVIEMQPWAP